MYILYEREANKTDWWIRQTSNHSTPAEYAHLRWLGRDDLASEEAAPHLRTVQAVIAEVPDGTPLSGILYAPPNIVEDLPNDKEWGAR